MANMLVQRVAFPALAPGAPPNLEILFNNRHYNIPFYNATFGTGQDFGRLEHVTLELSMV